MDGERMKGVARGLRRAVRVLERGKVSDEAVLEWAAEIEEAAAWLRRQARPPVTAGDDGALQCPYCGHDGFHLIEDGIVYHDVHRTLADEDGERRLVAHSSVASTDYEDGAKNPRLLCAGCHREAGTGEFGVEWE